jgi:hypothetical protein
MWATCPRCYQKHINLLNCRISSADISGYHAEFNKGHSSVGEWQGRGMVCELTWQGMGMGTTWARRGMCEFAFNVPSV